MMVLYFFARADILNVNNYEGFINVVKLFKIEVINNNVTLDQFESLVRKFIEEFPEYII